MNRRSFMALLGGTAAAWPLAARAQQSGLPVVGYLNSARERQYTHLTAVFRKALAESGFTEGQNVAIEYRWAEGEYGRLPALAADLVKRNVAVIVTHGPPAAKAAKAATTTIPIVFTSGDDPVRTGLVSSISRPGGNITGVTLVASQVLTKRLEMMHEFVPAARAMATLLNPQSSLGQADAVIVQPSLLHPSVAALALKQRLPSFAPNRLLPVMGGLMSYGGIHAELWRDAAVYVDKILKGGRPADLPVAQVTRFELVINLRTARALGLDIPPLLLARADEVIE